MYLSLHSLKWFSNLVTVMYNKNFTCIQRDVSSGEVSDLQADKQRIENANVGIEIQTAHIVLLNLSIYITGNKSLAYCLELEKMGQSHLSRFNPVSPFIARISVLIFSRSHLKCWGDNISERMLWDFAAFWWPKNPEVWQMGRYTQVSKG